MKIKGLFKKEKMMIEWVKTDNGFRSPDLLFVMYHINEITFE
jgi:ABC-type nitrate/sulfonate/bicarbonate transport system substrate-binding protein